MPAWLNETHVALRSVCEALARAACELLQIEIGEVLAEYRPALTPQGALGHEVEVFIYDMLAGGAGFAPQLAARPHELFEAAARLLAHCPEACSSSCYRCLRSFRNKLDHKHLDRIIGAQVLRHAWFGGYPPYDEVRFRSSIDILTLDLERQLGTQFAFERDARRGVDGVDVHVPLSPLAPAQVPKHGSRCTRQRSAERPSMRSCARSLTESHIWCALTTFACASTCRQRSIK